MKRAYVFLIGALCVVTSCWIIASKTSSDEATAIITQLSNGHWRSFANLCTGDLSYGNLYRLASFGAGCMVCYAYLMSRPELRKIPYKFSWSPKSYFFASPTEFAQTCWPGALMGSLVTAVNIEVVRVLLST